MSIETVEIRAFSGPSVVEINGSDQPAIVEINQGPAGTAGPNEITTATTTDLTGYIFGDGSFIGGATTATADPDPSTLVLRDSLGEAEFEGLRVNPGGSPDGDFDVGGGVFNVDMQTLSASCSGTFTASDVQATTATVSGTLTADHIHGNLAGSVYAHVRAGESLAKGDPVYVSGSHGTGANLIAIVSKADASDPLKMPAVGVMDAAVANNANGHMVITGTISDINTATYSVNAELYVAEGGGFTATPPNAYAQPVARVERSNTNNGAVIVKVNGLSAISPTASTLVRRDSSGVSDFNTINLGDLHTGGSPSAPYGSIGKSVLTGSSGVGISGNPDVALEAATHRLTLSSTGIALTSGTITTSQPLSLTQTWNAGAVIFKGIDVNITDTSSASGSLLMDLRVGGVSRFNVRKDGRLTAGDISLNGTATIQNASTISVNTAFNLTGATNPINFFDGSGNIDLVIRRDAANTLAQRNGTNAQESRVYGTYTSATNFERLNLKYNGTATAFQIGTEKGSAGGTARPLEFQTDGTTRVTIAANGVLSTTTNATFAGYVSPSHLRLTGGTGEAKIYKGAGDGSFAFYNVAETSRCIINVATDGVLKVRNIGNTDYAVADAQHRLQGTAPASATATGTAGDIRYDADYIYICTATNTWKRAAIATWP